MAESTRGKGVYYGWYVLAACFFVLFLSMGARTGLGVFVVPMSDDFHWSRGTISMALAIGWFTNGVTQPFIGRLYDRFGGRRIISISLLILGVGTMLLTWTNSIWFLLVVYGIVMSVAVGGASLVTIHALLARWFYRRRGVALSIGTSGASAGAVVLAPFAAYLILFASWRIAWFVLGAFVLCLALPLALLFIKDDPADQGEYPDGDAPEDGSPTRATGLSWGGGPLETDNWRDSYRSPPIWQMTGAYFVCGMTTAMISFHYVPFALDRGFSLGTAALAFGLMSGLNVLGVIAVGSMSDKLGRKNLLASVYAVRGLGYLVLLLTPGALGLWGFAVIVGLSWIATAALTASLTADIYGLKNMGTLNGLTSFAHQMGGALSILMGGVLYDLFGAYDVPFAIAGSLLVGATLVSFSIREKQYSSKYQLTPAPLPASTM